MNECKVCGLAVFKHGLCYYHADKVKTFNGLYETSEEMWPVSHLKYSHCSICGLGLLTEVERATTLCYYHLRE